MACPQICFCESGYPPWPLGTGQSQMLCHAGTGLSRPLFPGTPAHWLPVVLPKEADGKARRERAPRDDSRPQLPSLLLRPASLHPFQGPAPALPASQRCQQPGHVPLQSDHPPAIHTPPQRPRPLHCGSPAGLMPPSGPLLGQVSPPLLLCSPALEMVAVLTVINPWII